MGGCCWAKTLANRFLAPRTYNTHVLGKISAKDTKINMITMGLKLYVETECCPVLEKLQCIFRLYILYSLVPSFLAKTISTSGAKFHVALFRL